MATRAGAHADADADGDTGADAEGADSAGATQMFFAVNRSVGLLLIRQLGDRITATLLEKLNVLDLAIAELLGQLHSLVIDSLPQLFLQDAHHNACALWGLENHEVARQVLFSGSVFLSLTETACFCHSPLNKAPLVAVSCSKSC